MKPAKEQRPRNKMKGDKQMNITSNPTKHNSLNIEGNELMKKQPKITRKPKSGKSL